MVGKFYFVEYLPDKTQWIFQFDVMNDENIKHTEFCYVITDDSYYHYPSIFAKISDCNIIKLANLREIKKYFPEYENN